MDNRTMVKVIVFFLQHSLSLLLLTHTTLTLYMSLMQAMKTAGLPIKPITSAKYRAIIIGKLVGTPHHTF